MTGDVQEEHQSEEAEEEEAMGDTFVEWMRRATEISESHLKKAGVEDWVVGQRRRKYKLSGHFARRTDGWWSSRLVQWEPTGRRDIGRPCRRWEDSLNHFFREVWGQCKGFWFTVAQCRDTWQSLENQYATIEGGRRA